MGALAKFNADGFRVVADNALDLIVGTQAAGAGHVAANVREMATTLNTSLEGLDEHVGLLREANVEGFDRVTNTLGADLTSLKWLGGASVLVQAVGFAVVAKQLSGVRGEIASLGDDLRKQGQQLLEAQHAGNRHLEAIEDFARGQLETSQRILETLASSRRVEATQLIEQGWANLLNGYREEARGRFEQSLEFDNTVYLPHAELGEIYEQNGDLELAEKHFRKASDFSRDVDGDASGFSLLRLVWFLDEHDRRDEATTLLTDGLSSARLDQWRLGAAELAARFSLGDLAIRSVRQAIEEDDNAFLAAAASVPLSALGPPMAALLMELDGLRRGPALLTLQAICSKFKSIDVLSTLGAPTPERIEAARGQAATLLEECLLASYPSLVEVGSRVGSLAAEVETLLAEATSSHRDRHSRWLHAWERAYEKNHWPWRAGTVSDPGGAQPNPGGDFFRSALIGLVVTVGLTVVLLVFGAEDLSLLLGLVGGGAAGIYDMTQRQSRRARFDFAQTGDSEETAALRYEAMLTELFKVAREASAKELAEVAGRSGSEELGRLAETVLGRQLPTDRSRPSSRDLEILPPPGDALAAARTPGSQVPDSVSSVWVFIETGAF